MCIKRRRWRQSILEVFIMCFSGWALARKGVLDKLTQKKMNLINIWLFTPCLLFSKVAFSLTPQKLKELWTIPIIFVMTTAISGMVASIISTMLRLKRSQRNFCMAASMFSNTNSLPIALIQSMVFNIKGLSWGPDDNIDSMLGRGLGYMILYANFSTIARWSYGVHLLTQEDDELTQSALERNIGARPEGSLMVVPGLLEVELRPLSPTRRALVQKPAAVASRDQDSPRRQRESEDGWGNNHPHLSFQTITSPSSSIWHSRARRTQRGLLTFLKKVHEFATFPLYASLAAFLVVLIPPVQHFLMEDVPSVRGFLESAGACSIPITMLVLGACFYDDSVLSPVPLMSPEPRRATRKRKTASRQTQSNVPNLHREQRPDLVPSTRTESVKKTFKTCTSDFWASFSNSRKKRLENKTTPGETTTVIVSCLARMVVTPLIILPPMAALAAYEVLDLFKDPVFVVSIVLLIASPPALALAQIIQTLSGDTFERLFNRTIFWAYCLFTPPLTLFYVVISLRFMQL
ncbi:membrane transport protein-domain-containing protein [Cantharellus anzutake]|uniref:membrane transport protein-domain-containing protein n=1 Tax=Cantharellus anzutake TaxID=1750568 RepID=UPI0019056FA3|nr:membrane transport protein-domain-containing protein [Cantharellus anzutake]KAF8319486.1 membrane transport protein-domain-containing protein [Cantharellus anzutake]